MIAVSERKSLAGSVAAGMTPAWHYEYTIGRMLHHFDAETLEACLESLLLARTRSPHLTGIKIFEGGRQHDTRDLAA